MLWNHNTEVCLIGRWNLDPDDRRRKGLSLADLITATPPTRAGVANPGRQHVSPNPPPAAVRDSKSGISGSKTPSTRGSCPVKGPTDSSALLLRPFGVGFTASSFQTHVPSGCSPMAAYTASTAPTAQYSAQHAEESQIKSVHRMYPQLDKRSKCLGNRWPGFREIPAWRVLNKARGPG